MYPNDLDYRALELPNSDDYSIVIITGKELRHKNFAYRLIEEFGDRVIRWYEIDDSLSPKSYNKTSKINKIFAILKKIPNWLKKQTIKSLFKNIIKIVDDIFYRFFVIRGISKRMQEAQYRLFNKNIERVKSKSNLTPIKVSSLDVNSDKFISEIKKLSPYFILTLSGPLYKEELLNSAKGLAINQHAGYSPNYKGSNTIHWALYHRDLDAISSTVHITSSGADSGAILRRSTVTIFADDDIETIFIRSVALGTELMIEVVREIIKTNTIKIFPQPNRGKTYLNKELDFRVLKAIYRDFRSGWLKDALIKRREF